MTWILEKPGLAPIGAASQSFASQEATRGPFGAGTGIHGHDGEHPFIGYSDVDAYWLYERYLSRL